MQEDSFKKKAMGTKVIIKLSANGCLEEKLKLAERSLSHLEVKAFRHTATNIMQVSSAGIQAMVLGEYELSWFNW